jgi:putative cardiolipin synthase
LYVFDRQKLFVGSMNFDQRSVRLNTEVGVIIYSAALAQQTGTRFERMTEPANAYTVQLAGGADGSSRLTWQTVEAGQPVVIEHEPARHWWQRVWVGVLRLLPLEREL